jgi:hypothetical protein
VVTTTEGTVVFGTVAFGATVVTAGIVTTGTVEVFGRVDDVVEVDVVVV